MKEEQQKTTNEKRSAWAVVGPLFFSGTQFGLTVFVGAWLGKWLDDKYETAPIYLLICSFVFATVGFLSFLRLIKRANKKI